MENSLLQETKRKLIWHGVFLFLLGLFNGLIISYATLVATCFVLGGLSSKKELEGR